MKGSLAILILAAAAAAAHAGPARVAALDPPGMTPELEPATAQTPLDQVIARDAVASRGGLYDTALVLPTGAVAATARALPEGGLVTLAVGVAPFELVVDAGESFAKRGNVFGATAKLSVLRRATWQLAIEGSYQQVTTSCGDCIDDRGYAVAGGLGTGCLDVACRAILTLGAGLAIPEHGDNLALIMTSGLMLGTGEVRGLADIALLGEHAYGFAGARIGGARIAVDAGAVVAVENATRVTPMLGVAARM